MKTCINCGTKSDRFHCPECGQKMEVPRVTWRNIADEVGSHWLGFNTMFFRAVKHLTTRPETVIKRYLQGVRVQYIGPLGYLIVMSALYVLAFDYLEIDREEFFRRPQEAILEGVADEPNPIQQEMTTKITQKMSEYLRILPALNIPFFAFGVWLFYRRRGNTYLENIVALAYLQAHLLWLSMIGLVVFKFTDSQLTIVWGVLSAIYYVFAITRLYYRKNYFLTGLRSLISVLAGYLIMLITSGLIGAVIGTVMALSQEPT